MADIDDAQLRVLQGAHTLMDKLMRNPATRQQAEKLIKQIEPSVTTTEDYAKPYIEKIDGLEKKLDTFLTNQAQREIDGQLNQEYAALANDGWTTEGIEKLKKFQVERNIPSPIDAAGAWERRYPAAPQQASILSSADWGFARDNADEMNTLLWKDEDAFADKEAFNVITEFRNAADKD